MMTSSNINNEPPPESDFCEIMSKYLADFMENDNNATANVINTKCELYDIEELRNCPNCHNSKYTALHLNIHSLPAKFDQLKAMLTRLKTISINIDFVLLCETFLADYNADIFQIPGYNFIYGTDRLY